MKYQDAEKETLELLKDAVSLTLYHQKVHSKTSGISVECQVCFVPAFDKDAELFKGLTWGEVIKKIKLYLIPKEKPTQEEEPVD